MGRHMRCSKFAAYPITRAIDTRDGEIDWAVVATRQRAERLFNRGDGRGRAQARELIVGTAPSGSSVPVPLLAPGTHLDELVCAWLR